LGFQGLEIGFEAVLRLEQCHGLRAQAYLISWRRGDVLGHKVKLGI